MDPTPSPLSGDTTVDPMGAGDASTDSQSSSGPQAPSPAQPPVGDWKSLVVGALHGIAGNLGQMGLGNGTGASGARAAFLNQQQQRQLAIENQRAQAEQQSMSTFRSAQAGLAVANTARVHQEIDQMSESHKLDLAQKSAEYQVYLRDNGITPAVTIDDHSQAAQGAVGTLQAQSGDGKIGETSTIHSPAPSGQDGQMSVYAPSINDDEPTKAAQLKLVNKAAVAQGSTQVSPNSLQWQVPKQRVALVAAALNFLNPVDSSASNDKNHPDYVGTRQQTLQQQYDNYKKNGNPDGTPADPKILQIMKNKIDFYGTQIQHQSKLESDQKAADAKAASDATFANNIALAKARAQGAQDVKTAPVQGVTGAMGEPIKTPLGGPSEYNKRQDSFKKNLDDLTQTDKAYSQFSAIDQAAQQGNLTGPGSVVALFNAVGISAEPLKGKGFRINSNTIEEHKDALGLPDKLEKKLVALKNGEVVTPQQIHDYASIAQQAHLESHTRLYNSMSAAGVDPSQALPAGNGQKPDQQTLHIFAAVANRDPQKMRTALKAKGWSL